MLEILDNSGWQLLQLAKMRNESLFQLSQIARWWFRVNASFDIPIEIRDAIELW